MLLAHDLEQYITSVKMSKKCRILVEGKSDRAHFVNLLHNKLGSTLKNKVKVDTAEDLKGDCRKTFKCNKAKIEKIYDKTKNNGQYDSLFLLCDREFENFEISNSVLEKTDNSKILEKTDNSKANSNFYLTDGHSFENYFLFEDIINNAFSHLTSYQFKNEALDLLKNNFSEAFRIVSNISLTARYVEPVSYPMGVILWENFNISNDSVNFSIENWLLANNHVQGRKFKDTYSNNYEIFSRTDPFICIKMSRGHTAVAMLQRIFAYFLYVVGKENNESEARREADRFSKISEVQVSASLSQSWLESLKNGSQNYPVDLISKISIYNSKTVS